jgi:hypothetical protein
MMPRKSIFLLGLFSIMLLTPIIQADATSNPNLVVSAENSKFNNYFSGSMVVEVVIRDPNLQNTDEAKGEPDVTINGKTLRMVQATDGNYYAYFANVDKAKIADSTVGLPGEGLDFGVFCSRDTPSSVFGISLSDTDGFSVPSSGLTTFTNGNFSFLSCDGTPDSTNLNNVVRNARSINTNPNVLPGQIGLNPNAWPLVQLFSFGDVTIQYNAAGGAQRADLEYDEIPNISINIDRNNYPPNSEVFLTVNDFQLNQDPTDEDSWTFNVDSPVSTFYQAFDENGSDSANGNSGLVNLIPSLSNLGFENNGKLSINLGKIMEIKSNDEQPSTFVDDGGGNTFSQIVTLVETGPNSGIFDNADHGDKATIAILKSTPRGETGQIEYNEKSLSVLTGLSTASVSITKPTLTVGDGSKSLKSGTKFPIILIDSDQNLNSDSRDHLDVFRNTALIPTLKIGNPVTLEKSSNVKFYTTSIDSLTGTARQPASLLPDKNSARLFIDTTSISNGGFEKISFNLGITTASLSSGLIDTSISNKQGTNWLNVDLRSFEKDLNVNDFSDTTITLYFGDLSDSSPIVIIDPGDLSASHGLIQLDSSDVKAISAKSGSVFVVINFDSSNNTSNIGVVSDETVSQPIVLDFFSFGLDNSNDINNSIYRFELEETSDNSSKFEGTLEYSMANQLNLLDPSFIKTIRPIENDVKFIVTNRLIDEKGISISYSDLDKVGVTTTTSAKSDIQTNSGTVHTGSQSYRFGQPVTISLNDPDLNLKNDNVDIYVAINDPNSPYVDTIGKDGNVLLEILIKDIRYKRCTINGVEYGGLASTGFTLVETGPGTGIFEGTFKMPSQICDKSGTKLVSSAGGSLDAKYFDSRDSSGNSNIFSLLRDKSASSFSSQPQLSANKITIPTSGNTQETILSGSVANHKRGVPLEITLTNPDGVTQNFGAVLSDSGSYRASFSINEKSLSGVYKIQLSHNGVNVGLVSFTVSPQNIPDLVKNNAKRWSDSSISNSEFINGLEQMIEAKIIVISPTEKYSISERIIPNWLKNNAKWWSDDQISENEFIKSIQYLIKKGIIRV